MNRIDQRFSELKQQGRKALIPYITAGDPAPQYTVGFMHALVDAGADVIELGVPFSDPMADGPVIQKACERALKQGTRLVDLLEMVAEFRQTDTTTPIVLMGYLNPIERIGYEVFADKAASVGVDGVLVVDMPPEEADEFGPLLKARGLAAIFGKFAKSKAWLHKASMKLEIADIDESQGPCPNSQHEKRRAGGGDPPWGSQ